MTQATRPARESSNPPPCLVCGGLSYHHTPVLWQGLIDEWGLSPTEAERVDRQQGTRCDSCRCNLRSIALAGAILDASGARGLLDDWLAHGPGLRALEINPAGDLSQRLGRLPAITRVGYPEHDMHRLALPDDSFDLVVHSDTLEHVPDPRRGLSECLRVLAPGGWLAMTMPVIPGRLTRSRAGMRPSFHGGEHDQRPDYRVCTEFGADAWAMLLDAGFERAGVRGFAWPDACAWIARKPA